VTEVERRRRLYVENFLAELRARRGVGEALECDEQPKPDPSWGPVGTLAVRVLEPIEYEHVLAQHRAMVALERSRLERAPPEQRQTVVVESAPPRPRRRKRSEGEGIVSLDEV